MFAEQKDLFYLYINGETNRKLGFREGLRALSRLGVFFVRDLVKFCAGFIRRRNGAPIPDFRNKKLVFANTANNYEALHFLLKRYDDTVLVCSGDYVKQLPGSVSVAKYLRTLGLQQYFFVAYLALHKQLRMIHYEKIVRKYGFIHCFVGLLKENRPSVVFISNDHYPSSRALMLAAKKLSIPCIYLQHASVTKFFPPMRASHALLYGQYSEDVYRNIPGSEGQFIQVGNHKFDAFRPWIENKSATGRIGVAFNTLDPVPAVLDLCNNLSRHFPKDKIVLRAHPRDRRKIDGDFTLSSHSRETSLEFLRGIDVLIAGNSSILLEAAAMNVYPFQIYFTKTPAYLVDYYGFVRMGVAVEVESQEGLIRQIKEIIAAKTFDSRQRTAYYDASVGSEYEFRVEEHIVTVIDKILALDVNSEAKEAKTTVDR